MNITDVQIIPSNEDRLKAYVTIVLDDCFVIRDIKIIHGHGGLFVAMPAKKRKDGSFRDIAHPINQQMRDVLEARILSDYERMMSEKSQAS